MKQRTQESTKETKYIETLDYYIDPQLAGSATVREDRPYIKGACL